MRLDELTVRESSSGVPGHERQLLEAPGEVKHHLGQLSVPGAVTGSTAEALPGLGALATVYGVETEGSTEGLAVELKFEGEPLRAEGLLKLMEALAPVKLPESWCDRKRAEVTLNGWIRMGQQANGDEWTGPYEDRKSGLRAWTQLGQGHADLMAALEPLRESSRPLPREDNIIRPAKWIYGWAGGAEGLSNDPLISTPELNLLLREVYGEEGARTQVIQAMRYAAENRSDDVRAELQGLGDEELFDKFNTAGIGRRNEFAGGTALQGRYRPDGVSWSASDEAVQKFQTIYAERYGESFKTDDGRVMYVHGLEPGEDIRRAYDARQRIFVDRDRTPVYAGDYCAAYECEIMELNTIIGARTVVVPGSIKYQKLGLVPTVRWSVDREGKRTLRELPEHAPFTAPDQYVPSSIAGLMVMASLQPERYRRWHKNRVLPGSEHEQEMYAAQVPYIVKQNAGRRLLDNRLSEQAERLLQYA